MLKTTSPQLSKQAKKFLDKQNDKIFECIVSAINKLPEGDVAKLKANDNLYRLRVGSYRIIFTMDVERIVVKKIDNRGQVYKKLKRC